MKMTKSTNQGGSPSKLGGTFGSPSKTGKGMSLTAKARRAGKSPKKGDVIEGSKEKKKESGLASPTSISMQNTFIIMNADDSFDQYYAQMRKRKAGMTGNMENSIGHNGGSPGAHRESIFGVVSGVAPAARDGHTCEISE